MLFNSFEFGIFFIIVTLAYFALPHRQRWFFLLAASCYFYMVFVPVYILILFFTIIVDYWAGIYIEEAAGRKRRAYLLFSIFANLSVLALFKYFNFFNSNLASLTTMLGLNYPVENLSILLPIGLSFHTFQSLSYTIEVYRGHQRAERQLGIFALYVMFYPQLVAGPIERPQNMLHQFHARHSFNYSEFVSGLRMIAWGLLKKMVVADRLAIFVNSIYGDPGQYTGFPLILATYFFAFQIYYDFSGYSDIALGCARVMGFRLMANFRQPYLATSISDFWQRWHISLSTWFRDYLYIPLGGNRVSRWHWVTNTLIVFMVSGLWHGANWTFVIWGALHGVYTIATGLTGPWLSKILIQLRLTRFTTFWHIVQAIITFNLVSFAWIFFRAQSLTEAGYIVTHLFTEFRLQFNFGVGLGLSPALIVGFCILFIESVQWAHRANRLRFDLTPAWLRWSGYYFVTMLIVLLGVIHSDAQFIYFQF